MGSPGTLGRARIGCSGYSYDDWEGPFYPPGLSREERLEHYALFFPFVELTFTHFQMPTSHGLLSLAERTPSSFLFALAAHKSLTHETTDVWREDASLFLRAALSLAERGRLAAVLLTLPPSFSYRPENRVYLGELLDRLAPLPLALEFRDRRWMNERVTEGLARRGAAYLRVDGPEGILPPPFASRSPFAYLRLRGKEPAAGWTAEGAERYDYDYSDAELRSLLPVVHELRREKADTFISFGNHPRGRSVANARRLRELVDAFQG